MNIIEHIPTISNTLKGLKSTLKEADFSIIKKKVFEQPYNKNLSVFKDALFIDLNIDSSFQINVYNSSDDFQERENSILDQEHFYKNLISDKAIIEYLIQGNLKGNASTSASKYFALDVAGKQDIAINWCKVHDHQQSTLETVTKEVFHLKELFTECKTEDFWSNFNEYEGVGFSMKGGLTGELSIDLMEVLSSIFAPVFSLTSCGQTIPFDIGASSTIGFSFSKQDDFYCFIYKKGNKFNISLKKQKAKTVGLGLSTAIGIKLTDDTVKQINTLIDDYITQYLGDTIDSIKGKIKKKTDPLLLQILLQKIDLPLTTTADDFIDYLEDYQEKIENAKNKVLQLLKLKLEIGLEYSYRKALTQNCMLEATVSEKVLQKHIANLLKLDISSLMTDTSKDINIQQFMSEEGLEVTKTLAIGLKLGNWSLGRKVSHSEKFIDIKHGTDSIKREVVYGFEKKIESDLLGDRNASFSLVFDIETPTPKERLSYNDLEYNLTIQNTFEDLRVQKKDQKGIHRYLFSAITWGIIEEEEYQPLIDELWKKISQSNYYKIETLFQVPPSLLKDLLLVLGSKVSLEDFSKALAVGVLPTKGIEKSNYMDNRKAFYSPIILEMIQKNAIDSLLKTPYYKRDNKSWKNKDRFLKQHEADSFFDRYEKTLLTFKILNTYFENNEDLPDELLHSPLDKVFDRVKLIFNKTNTGKKRNNGFEERWFGHLLYATTQQFLPEKLELLERSMIIKYEKEGVEQTIIIG